jgi:hypothetical protein
VRKVPRKWGEPLLVGLVAAVLLTSFWAAWPHLPDSPDSPDGGVTDARSLGLPNQQATDGPTPTPTPTGTTTPNPSRGGDGKTLGELFAQHRSALSDEAARVQRVAKDLAATSDFRLVDFNALAASMNNPGRRNANWPKYPARTSGLWSMMQAHDADIGTFQEFQVPQQSTLRALMGDEYGMYPTGSDRLMPRAIVWRTDRFELVSAETLFNAWFSGSTRHTPRVLLRDKRTGLEFYVATYHNPPDTQGNQARWRHGAMNSQVASTRELIDSTGKPVIITGDMNDRGPVWSAWSSIPGFSAVSGPVNHLVDWILGSGEVTFSDYVIDGSSRSRRISDHDMLVTDVHIDAG